MMAAHADPGPYARWGKRCLDVALASTALVVLAPVIGAVAAAVRWRMGGPVLFRQTRPGRNEVPFTILKFRTMSNGLDAKGEPLPDNKRLTPLGALLRKTSLDELPQLVNVLRGEMSLVGPRPLLARYHDFYTPRELGRHDVRPGVTGWAQVNGRNELDWDARLECDAWYRENVSFALDLRILAATVAKVVRHDSVTVDTTELLPLDVARGATEWRSAG
jgi:sugar transferase EpsL